jgi:hypothetical protein
VSIVLLGPQRFKPTLAAALASVGVKGRVALVTAGWQEREPEDEPEALAGRALNLRLHARGEEVFASDRELKEEHRKKQERLQVLQDLYRLRIEGEIEAMRVLVKRAPDAATLGEEWVMTLEELRAIDRWHLDRVRAIHAEYEGRLKPGERDAVVAARREIAAMIDDVEAVVIAGGHVAVLLNRLKLFDVASLIGERPIVAWSAGAMVLAERVVLFHDAPPQGQGVSQVLDEGLGLVPRIVVLPSPRQRLRLQDHERVSFLSRRLAPAACVALDDGATVTYDKGRYFDAENVLRLDASGEIDTTWAA